MKWLLLILFLFEQRVFAQPDLNTGLVAYYPFNGNASDESGNRNNPSVMKAGFAADRFGKPNAACSFNGKNNYIRIPDHASLHFNKGFSISAWVLVKDFYEGRCHGNRIIMKGYTDYEAGNYFLTFDDNQSTKGANCSTEKPAKAGQLFYGPHIVPATTDYIVPNKWYLLTYTYDGANAYLYVDCKLYGKGAVSNYNFSNADDLFFGRMENQQYPYWFNGLLDEVRIYNRVLSKEELALLCDTRKQELPATIPCNGENIVNAKFDHAVTNCTTASFKLQAASTNKLQSLQWYFGDGSSSAKTAVTHTYKKYGVYKVRAITVSKTGCTDTFTRTIEFRKLTTDFSVTETGEPGLLEFKAKNNNAAYTWDPGDGTEYRNESVITHQYREAGNYSIRLFAKNNTGCTDTVKKTIPLIFPQELITAVPAADSISVSTIITSGKLEKRNKDIIRTIPVDHETISLALYDNGMIDGDSITLVFNNEIIMAKQLLGNTALQLILKLDPVRESNELLMYAENLGSIPPNTALLIISDGNNRYTVNVSSSKTSSGVIAFTLKKNRLSSGQ